MTADAGISEDGAFRPHFFENLFRFEENLDFPTYDTIFSSSRSRRPDFHRMGELPSVAGVPTVDVFCDDGRLTVLVAKRAGHVLLSADELQLGDGCSRSHDLPKHHVFAYGVDECGTTRVVSGFVLVCVTLQVLGVERQLCGRWITVWRCSLTRSGLICSNHKRGGRFLPQCTSAAATAGALTSGDQAENPQTNGSLSTGPFPNQTDFSRPAQIKAP